MLRCLGARFRGLSVAIAKQQQQCRPSTTVLSSQIRCQGTTVEYPTEYPSLLDLSKVGVLMEDAIFDNLCDTKTQQLSVKTFLNALCKTGLRTSDPRLKESIQNFQKLSYKEGFNSDTVYSYDIHVDRESFKQCIHPNLLLILQAFQKKFVIPEFQEFCDDIESIYWKCRTNTTGKVANYIPQLSRFSPDLWGVSICTVDGQRFSIGDSSIPFCLQSCSKPFMYALAMSELGPELVHNYVGQEPSGQPFNTISLNKQNIPHNPMVNAGAILLCSLLKTGTTLADRFSWVTSEIQRAAGNEFIGFSNATFLSEKETADRNFALGYYMKENDCFPSGTDLIQTLDFYFQMCSLEVTSESASVMAATFANGGICPINDDSVYLPTSVRNTLSLMHSCGMYDFSGQFAFSVGLPSKSGVSGAILVVIPNVMGICLWSPPLDVHGNSCRGLQFCDELVNQFNFHNFDNLKNTKRKKDPRKQDMKDQVYDVVQLLFGAYHGDISAIRRYMLKGMDMNCVDYDQRTALHVAASEGKYEIALYLLEKCKVKHNPKDRWGHTPLDEARKFGKQDMVILLESYEEKEACDTTIELE